MSEVTATHRHRKRGSEYCLIGVGKMQAENWRELIGEQNLVEGEKVGTAVDMREVSIYRSVDDGSLWVRPVEEFNDGRFEPLRTAPETMVDDDDARRYLAAFATNVKSALCGQVVTDGPTDKAFGIHPSDALKIAACIHLLLNRPATPTN